MSKTEEALANLDASLNQLPSQTSQALGRVSELMQRAGWKRDPETYKGPASGLRKAAFNIGREAGKGYESKFGAKVLGGLNRSAEKKFYPQVPSSGTPDENRKRLFARG